MPYCSSESQFAKAPLEIEDQLTNIKIMSDLIINKFALK